MPKLLKDRKIQIYQDVSGHMDDIGAWHSGKCDNDFEACECWANVRGQKFSDRFLMDTRLSGETIVVTITRSTAFEPNNGDYIYYRDKFWKITAIDTLTDTIGHDCKMVAVYDSMFTAKMLSKTRP